MYQTQIRWIGNTVKLLVYKLDGRNSSYKIFYTDKETCRNDLLCDQMSLDYLFNHGVSETHLQIKDHVFIQNNMAI